MSETPEFCNYVDGQWAKCSASRLYSNENPAHRGSSLGSFQASLPQDVTAAIDAAQKAFSNWKSLVLAERQRLVGNFIALLGERQDALSLIVAKENGKTIREASAEVVSAIAEGTYHYHQSSRLLGHTLPVGSGAIHGWVQYEPLGVIGVISPWNFPVNVLCRKALPALLVGNTVVLKPASFTPWSGIYLAELFQQAGFPPGVFNCVTGSGAMLGDSVIQDERVRAISFTGSTEVGKDIQRKASALLKRTQLELGGKNALIIMDDADIDASVGAAATAGFACAGQWCTSTSRILVQKAVYSKFIDQLAKVCEERIVGDPLDEKTEMGPVAGSDQYDRIVTAIERAEEEGANKITGGPLAGSDGYFVRPTLFADVTPSMDLFQTEVFGPVLALSSFDRLDDALRLANESRYALSSAIFTRDMNVAFRYIDRIDAGIAHVNLHTGYKDPSLPFGGRKESGFGPPENDQTGLEFFLDKKAVYIMSSEP